MTEYVPITFVDTTKRSARKMNYLGTQFSCAESFIDIHLHDDLYYEKSLADTRYSVPNIALLDADLVDEKHYNELIGGLMPVGISFGWNGTDVDIPSNWHIADGSTQNGIVLPDTRGRILQGAGSTYPARSTGGNAVLSTVGGTINIAGHVLTLAELTSHYHNWVDAYRVTCHVFGSEAAVGALSTRAGTTNYNHDAADEAHGAGSNQITLNPFSILPLWFCKYLITKIS